MKPLIWRPASMLALAVSLVGTSVRAEQYESEIEIESQLDLYDLAERGDIGTQTLESLVALFREGVDLNTATREELYELPNLTYAEVDAILLYRKLQGSIRDPADLVKANALSARQLAQIAPFLVTYRSEPKDRPLTGSVRMVSAFSANDTLVPPAFLQLRLRGPQNLSAGVSLLGVRRELGDVFWDEGRVTPGLSAEPAAYGPRLPKFFIQWKTAQRSAIAGTFRLGFGQRLTLDNTLRSNPSGFYLDDTIFLPSEQSKTCRELKGERGVTDCDEDAGSLRVTEDFDWRESFRGVAGSLQEVELGNSLRLSLHGFGSFQGRSIYQYEVYNRDTCEDPRFDDNPDCKAPSVYIRQEDISAPAGRFQYVTLPDVFNETAAGGHARLYVGPRYQLGLTGYYADMHWKVEGAHLDFQEYARYPFGGGFGAVGVDGAALFGFVNFYAELARSFDAIPKDAQGEHGGGDVGFIQRTTIGPKTSELEVSFRYYGPDFVNPYARAISQPDEWDGQRVRNELGTRVRYLAKPNEDWRASGALDLWRAVRDPWFAAVGNRMGLDVSGRVDFVGLRWLQVAGWADARNHGINLPSRAVCLNQRVVEDASEFDTLLDRENFASGRFKGPECIDERTAMTARVSVVPLSRSELLSVWVQGQHAWLGDGSSASRGYFLDTARRDAAFWVGAQSRPVAPLRLRARTRWQRQAYNWESLVRRGADGEAGTADDVSQDQVKYYSNAERGVLTTLDATWTEPSRTWALGLRYDFQHGLKPQHLELSSESGAVENVLLFERYHMFRAEFEARF